MASSSWRDRTRSGLRRSEPWTLALAGLAIVLYMAELAGLWSAGAPQVVVRAVLLAVDVAFVAEVVAKAALLGPRYRRSAWLLVDVLAALPILASLAAVPGFVYGLRFLRGVRMLRALRALRLLRAIPGIRRAQRRPSDQEAQDLPEERVAERALAAAVLLFAAVFLCAIMWFRSAGVPGRVMGWQGQPLASAPSLTVTVDDGHGLELITVPASRALHGGALLELALVAGTLLGMALVLVVVRFQVPAMAARQVRALLNVALPHQVAEHFLREPDRYDTTERGPVTVIFCDIEGFTATVESLGDDLDTVKRHLERAMDVVVEEHRRYDLIVDKFIGDAIMSFRGGSLVAGDAPEHARRVVRATLAGAQALQRLQDPHFQRMKVGGASAERALIGTFGTSSRLSYTVLGDRVNLAARLEGSCNALGVRNLFCDRTRQLCGDIPEVVWRGLGAVAVQGKEEVVEVHEAVDPAQAQGPWLASFGEGVRAWRVGALEQAELAFAAADQGRPGGDGPAQAYLRAIAGAKRSSRPFEPVLRTRKGG